MEANIISFDQAEFADNYLTLQSSKFYDIRTKALKSESSGTFEYAAPTMAELISQIPKTINGNGFSIFHNGEEWIVGYDTIMYDDEEECQEDETCIPGLSNEVAQNVMEILNDQNSVRDKDLNMALLKLLIKLETEEEFIDLDSY